MKEKFYLKDHLFNWEKVEYLAGVFKNADTKFKDAEFVEEDVHRRKNLAYYSTTFAGDGFVLVGDAAAFMDPFYSPGMDWISFTASSAADLITEQRKGSRMAERIDNYHFVPFAAGG